MKKNHTRKSEYIKILLVEDDVNDAFLLTEMLQGFYIIEFNVTHAKRLSEATQLLDEANYDIILLDLTLPDSRGLETFSYMHSHAREIPIVVLTGADDTELSINTIKKGAQDYLVKGHIGKDGLIKSIIHSIERKKLEKQFFQSAKMASVGQLAAGIAHEINNPMGFVNSNIGTLEEYITDLKKIIAHYENIIASFLNTTHDNIPTSTILKQIDDLQSLKELLGIDFIIEDIQHLIKESRDGIQRIKEIVQNLKNFAHPGENKPTYANINANIDSTLNIIWNEIKNKATVIKEYGNISEIKCYPQQLNQVFLNLLINAAHAIQNKGTIKIKTSMADNGYLKIQISDTGAGISQDDLSKIFDPFFTTKEVGKGTGLGLNVAYNIIEKHKGSIDVKSDIGKGTTFTILLPQ